MEKYLTVGQLKEILNEQVTDENKDNLVVIDVRLLTNQSFVGASPCMTCKPTAYFGFDWDSGRFFITPTETLYFKK